MSFQTFLWWTCGIQYNSSWFYGNGSLKQNGLQYSSVHWWQLNINFLLQHICIWIPKVVMFSFFPMWFSKTWLFSYKHHIKTKLVDKELNTAEFCAAPGPIVQPCSCSKENIADFLHTQVWLHHGICLWKVILLKCQQIVHLNIETKWIWLNAFWKAVNKHLLCVESVVSVECF